MRLLRSSAIIKLYKFKNRYMKILGQKEYYGKYSDELQTTAEQTKTAQYLNIFLIANPVKTLTLRF